MWFWNWLFGVKQPPKVPAHVLETIEPAPPLDIHEYLPPATPIAKRARSSKKNRTAVKKPTASRPAYNPPKTEEPTRHRRDVDDASAAIVGAAIGAALGSSYSPPSSPDPSPSFDSGSFSGGGGDFGGGGSSGGMD